MEAIPALVVRAGTLLSLIVDLDERGVDVEDNGIGPSRRCRTTPDLLPHFGERHLQRGARRRCDLVEGAPHRRVRGDEPEQCLLGAEVLDVRAALAAAGEHRHLVHEHLAAVVQRRALTANGDRGRERITEAQPVGEGTKRVQPDVSDDTRPTGFHDDRSRAGSFHLGSALLVGVDVALTTTVSPARRAFSRIRAGQLTRSRERSELG